VPDVTTPVDRPTEQRGKPSAEPIRKLVTGQSAHLSFVEIRTG
jgi:hypothetical protein